MILQKIISGGQSGADQAGLDAAIANGLEHGGYCPAGRKSEFGPIPEKYLLVELDTELYHLRTEKNVIESDATLILTRGKLSRGSKLTRDYCIRHQKPCLHIDFMQKTPNIASYTCSFLIQYKVQTLNVAGQRLTSQPGIYRLSFEFLDELIRETQRPQNSVQSFI